MHWGISYLREDIQDLRQDVRALHTRIDARFALLLTVMIGLNGLVIGSVVAALRFYLPPNIQLTRSNLRSDGNRVLSVPDGTAEATLTSAT